MNPRLATFENDGWELRSGEEAHKQRPDQFWIPTLEQRENLRKGQAAKLIFDIDARDEHGVVHRGGERMWVLVKNILGAFYLGILDNQPACFEPGTGLPGKGTELFFKPEHVVDIADPPSGYITETYGKEFLN